MKINEKKMILGRLKGALVSGHSAAYLGILIIFLTPFTRIIDKIWPGKKREILTEVPPTIILVGMGRSGSTIAYQILTRFIGSRYLSNLHALFPKNGYRFFSLTTSWDKLKIKLKNYYGYTSSFYDVNEGNDLVAQLTEGNPGKEEIRKRFLQLATNLGAGPNEPLLFKNVRFYPDIFALHEAVPEITFLKIDRNIEQIIQSVVKAHHELKSFHPIPDFMRDLELSGPIEFIVMQVCWVESNINKQLARLPKERLLRWSYEDFCANSSQRITEMATFLNTVPRHLEKLEASPLRASNSQKVTDEELAEIHHYLEKYKARFESD